MNKTLKMIFAAVGALVLGGIGEGVGAELLKKATKADDNTYETSTENTTTVEESDDDIVFEEITTETTED